MVKTFAEVLMTETEASSNSKSTDIMTTDSLDKEDSNNCNETEETPNKSSLDIMMGNDGGEEEAGAETAGVVDGFPSQSPRMGGLAAVVDSSLRSIQSASSAISSM